MEKAEIPRELPDRARNGRESPKMEMGPRNPFYTTICDVLAVEKVSLIKWVKKFSYFWILAKNRRKLQWFGILAENGRFGPNLTENGRFGRFWTILENLGEIWTILVNFS